MSERNSLSKTIGRNPTIGDVYKRQVQEVSPMGFVLAQIVAIMLGCFVLILSLIHI